MKLNLLIFMIAAGPVCLVYGQGAQDKRQIEGFVDSAIKRLPLKEFQQLPKAIIRSLETQGCSVPQAYDKPPLQNVISGEFMRRAQRDWAVLCSINGVSSIWVFWGGSAKAISKIAEAEDAGYLQTIDEYGTLGFSRSIAAVGKEYIIKHSRAYDGPKLPPIHHQGIDDAYLGKASTIRYYYREKWLELQGAD